MAYDEKDPPWEYRSWQYRKWHLSSIRLRLDLYRLFCAIQATQYDPRLPGAPPNDAAIGSLKDECEQEEIEHSLVSVAAMTRVLLDQGYDAEDRALGVLFPDASKEVKTPLDLREACNKIIHAEARKFQRAEDFTDSEFHGLTGSLYLEGERRGKPWRAELDATRFIAAVARLTAGGSNRPEPEST